MKRVMCDSAALSAVLGEIEHNCSMLALSDEETAAEDVAFYVPQIQRAADELRRIINQAEPAQHNKQIEKAVPGDRVCR